MAHLAEIVPVSVACFRGLRGFCDTLRYRNRDSMAPTAPGYVALLAGFLLGSLVCGCASTQSYFAFDMKPTGDACEVAATWYNHVVTTADTVHQGTPLRGIAGRLYLFGSDHKYPLLADGSVVIDLYDETKPHPADKQVSPLEEWRIDKDTLKRLQKKDVIGEGYTLFLPWSTYKPEITRIQLKVRYEPTKGTPLYAAGAPMSLTPDEIEDRVLPAGYRK